MRLKEYEGKELLADAGIALPTGFLIKNDSEIKELAHPVALKAQILAGKRGKAGGILFAKDLAEAKKHAKALLGKTLLGEKVEELLVEEKLSISKEYYLGILFDTAKRQPIVLASTQGGMDIEELQKKHPQNVMIVPIDIPEGLPPFMARDICKSAGFSGGALLKVSDVLVRLYDTFVKNDVKMLEINPLAETSDGKILAADCKAVLDDDANFRRKKNFPPRTGAREPTSREIAAHKIDEGDYRGVAGKTFIDLEGDIAMLTSGGGASMTILDALLSYGGKPANFTEYSGNPPPEKVERLTRITLDKKGLSGCLVAGVIANFTDIAETMRGFIAALKEIKPKYPIVVRRAGPNDQEAYRVLREARKEHGLNIHIFDEHTPLTKAAKIMVELSNQFKKGSDTTKPVPGEI